MAYKGEVVQPPWFLRMPKVNYRELVLPIEINLWTMYQN